MAFKDKPINQWGESDYLEAHIELWTRIGTFANKPSRFME